MRIFINYRREDTLAATRSIDERLRREFGDDAVFRDIDDIPLGSDFVEHIGQAVGAADVMIAVIGAGWVSPRLKDNNDVLRLEIEAALKAKVRIIPVLVEGASMPTRDQVPASLEPLLRRNGLRVDFGRDFNSHVTQLVEGIQSAFPGDRAKLPATLSEAAAAPMVGPPPAKPNASLMPIETRAASSPAAAAHSRKLVAAGAAVVLLVLGGLIVRYRNAADGPPADATLPRPLRTLLIQNGQVELVEVPGGTFTMGSPESEVGRDKDEGPQHEVTMSAFWIGRFEVTHAQYAQFLTANPTARKPDGWVNSSLGDEPVVNVSWNDANAFAKWAGGRLPTEAEWEYAARAGKADSRYGELGEIAWYDTNSGGRAHPVGQLQANARGLYDMLGNVGEWCADWYGSYEAQGVRDPVGSPKGIDRVIRGGSCNDGADHARSAHRGTGGPDGRLGNRGFRLAWTESAAGK